jgi:hypothetical protein
MIQTILRGLLPILFVSCLGLLGGLTDCSAPRSTTAPRSSGRVTKVRDKSFGSFLTAAQNTKPLGSRRRPVSSRASPLGRRSPFTLAGHPSLG